MTATKTADIFSVPTLSDTKKRIKVVAEGLCDALCQLPKMGGGGAEKAGPENARSVMSENVGPNRTTENAGAGLKIQDWEMGDRKIRDWKKQDWEMQDP